MDYKGARPNPSLKFFMKKFDNRFEKEIRKNTGEKKPIDILEYMRKEAPEMYDSLEELAISLNDHTQSKEKDYPLLKLLDRHVSGSGFEKVLISQRDELRSLLSFKRYVIPESKMPLLEKINEVDPSFLKIAFEMLGKQGEELYKGEALAIQMKQMEMDKNFLGRAKKSLDKAINDEYFIKKYEKEPSLENMIEKSIEELFESKEFLNLKEVFKEKQLLDDSLTVKVNEQLIERIKKEFPRDKDEKVIESVAVLETITDLLNDGIKGLKTNDKEMEKSLLDGYPDLGGLLREIIKKEKEIKMGLNGKI